MSKTINFFFFQMFFFVFFLIDSFSFGSGDHDVELTPGEYYIDCKGAQGGSGADAGKIKSTGGKGAYVRAKLHTAENVTLKFTVGSMGGDITNTKFQNAPKGGNPDGGAAGVDWGYELDQTTSDMSGGGGGSTSVSFSNGTILIYAGGGSGAAYYMDGCPGGGLRELFCPIKGNKCKAEDDTDGHGNKNHKGGKGHRAMAVPGSGGGGGYYGGKTDGGYMGTFKIKEDSWKIMACSGSSYINDKFLEEVDVKSGNNEGDGYGSVETIYKCPSTCADCSSDTVCTKCSGEYGLYQSQCIIPCPDGYSLKQNVCEKCQSNCAKCDGSSLSLCTACSGSLKLYGTTCLNSCPSGYYDNGANVCEKCSDNCKSCNSANQCTECKGDHILSNGKCICPDSYYEVDSATCAKCSDNCLTCENTPDTCTSCSGHYNLYDNQCVLTCPEGTYESSDTTCDACTDGCKICNSSEICSECYDGYIPYKGKCYSQCPDSTYYDQATGTCAECSTNCTTCSSSATQCTSCPDGYELDSNFLCLPIINNDDTSEESLTSKSEENGEETKESTYEETKDSTHEETKESTYEETKDSTYEETKDSTHEETSDSIIDNTKDSTHESNDHSDSSYTYDTESSDELQSNNSETKESTNIENSSEHSYTTPDNKHSSSQFNDDNNNIENGDKNQPNAENGGMNVITILIIVIVILIVIFITVIIIMYIRFRFHGKRSKDDSSDLYENAEEDVIISHENISYVTDNSINTFNTDNTDYADENSLEFQNEFHGKRPDLEF